MGEEIYRLWLSALYGLGSRRQNQLLEYFGSAKALFYAPEDNIRSVPGLSEQQFAAVARSRDLSRIEIMLREMENKKMTYISREHASFPSLLKIIPDPPVGVFYIGGLPDDGSPKVSVIGSRRCTEYGLTAARMLCKPLGKYNVTVISGMARGVDSMAHKGAIEGGGRTIAVLGCGADVCYPAENRALREDIIAHGCVLSEYPPGVKPSPSYFPARNRIISGLSNAVVVVEAAKKSGTLITVEQAQDQGRDVMAVPGAIVSPLSEGTNALIRDGAATAASYEDILAVLHITPKNTEEKQERISKAAADTLAPEEKAVYDTLSFEPMTFDALSVRTDIQVNALHHLCTMLEIKGFIKKLPGLRYIKNI